VTEASQPSASALLVGEAPALDQFLSELEGPAPSPCGGSAAAAAAAMAASLVTMVARESNDWADGPGIASQGRALRARLMTLCADDVVAFGDVITVMRNRAGTSEQRDFALGEALLRAAEVPLQIAEAAADVAELAALASSEGSPQLRPDATTAAILAEAAVRGATHLVEINLATVPGDHNSSRAERLASAAAAARARALGSV
jgi:formiminotetrahydrofolate cyclodeaminase